MLTVIGLTIEDCKISVKGDVVISVVVKFAVGENVTEGCRCSEGDGEIPDDNTVLESADETVVATTDILAERATIEDNCNDVDSIPNDVVAGLDEGKNVLEGKSVE